MTTTAPAPDTVEPAPRYVVDTSRPLHRIVRADGTPLGLAFSSAATQALERLRDAAEPALRQRPAPRGPKEAPSRAAPPPDDAAPTGPALAALRSALGVSQYKVAASSGIARGVILEIERGRRPGIVGRVRLYQALLSLQAEVAA